MPLTDQQARRLYSLTVKPPYSELTSYERGELRALLRSCDPAQRTAVVRALALSDPAASADPEAQQHAEAYVRGADRAAGYDFGGVQFETLQPDNVNPNA